MFKQKFAFLHLYKNYFRRNIWFVVAEGTLFFVIAKIRNFEFMDSFCSINIANFQEVIKLNYFVYTLLQIHTPINVSMITCSFIFNILLNNWY
jgi:hypothetical protein